MQQCYKLWARAHGCTVLSTEHLIRILCVCDPILNVFYTIHVNVCANCLVLHTSLECWRLESTTQWPILNLCNLYCYTGPKGNGPTVCSHTLHASRVPVSRGSVCAFFFSHLQYPPLVTTHRCHLCRYWLLGEPASW